VQISLSSLNTRDPVLGTPTTEASACSVQINNNHCSKPKHQQQALNAEANATEHVIGIPSYSVSILSFYFLLPL